MAFRKITAVCALWKPSSGRGVTIEVDDQEGYPLPPICGPAACTIDSVTSSGTCVFIRYGGTGLAVYDYSDGYPRAIR